MRARVQRSLSSLSERERERESVETGELIDALYFE